MHPNHLTYRNRPEQLRILEHTLARIMVVPSASIRLPNCRGTSARDIGILQWHQVERTAQQHATPRLDLTNARESIQALGSHATPYSPGLTISHATKILSTTPASRRSTAHFAPKRKPSPVTMLSRDISEWSTPNTSISPKADVVELMTEWLDSQALNMRTLGWQSPDFECHLTDDMIRGPTKSQKALHFSIKVKKLASHAGSSVGRLCPNSHSASPGPGSAALRYGPKVAELSKPCHSSMEGFTILRQ